MHQKFWICLGGCAVGWCVKQTGQTGMWLILITLYVFWQKLYLSHSVSTFDFEITHHSNSATSLTFEWQIIWSLTVYFSLFWEIVCRFLGLIKKTQTWQKSKCSGADVKNTALFLAPTQLNLSINKRFTLWVKQCVRAQPNPNKLCVKCIFPNPGPSNPIRYCQVGAKY